jgi:phosphoglycerol transferase MdoB-like AlkP superfamily enzyme
MKIISKTFSGFLAMFIAVLLSFSVYAQDKGLDVNVDVNKKGSDWYTQPWVWIVGGAIFVLLLVALMRGSGNRRD